MTPKQEKFIDGIVRGLDNSEAYRQAGYSVKNMKANAIAIEASRLRKNPNVSPIIKERQEALANKAIWDRERALESLATIATVSLEHIETDAGEKVVYNAAAANAATKAIEQANKMCGYNEPEKHEVKSTVEIVLGEAEKWAE